MAPKIKGLGSLGWDEIATQLVSPVLLAEGGFAGTTLSILASLGISLGGTVALQGPDKVWSEIENLLGDVEEAIGAPVLHTLLSTSMGIDLTKASPANIEAINTLKRVVGFGAAFPMVMAGISAQLKRVLGDHAPEGALHLLGKMGEELGLNFFIGSTLERVFETAVGRPLEETINEQKRPNRLDPNTIRQLLRRHALSPAKAQKYMARLGYPEDDAKDFLAIGDSQLPLGDLQTAYLDGVIDEGRVRDELGKQGLSDDDVDLLVTVYLHKAQLAGGDVYRSVARAAFLDMRISEGQFRSILATINVPKVSIDLEVAAVDLERHGREHKLTVGEIQTAYRNGSIKRSDAMLRLLQAGYSDADANLVITGWEKAAAASKIGLTVQRVLAYELGGVLSQHQAYEALISQGVNPTEASLLAAHPGAEGGVYAHELSPTTVVGALKDGVITQDRAAALLRELRVDPTEASLLIASALATTRHKLGTKAAAKSLTVADIHDAVDLGLASRPWAVRELELLGYSEADASLLTAIWAARSDGTPPAGWQTLS